MLGVRCSLVVVWLKLFSCVVVLKVCRENSGGRWLCMDVRKM